ncbi:mitochondrial carrier homolog 2 [Drosophila ficusphila]|uniref:mitochondrial carrier homolog 2 n=1 Tax=Drosophila ficusphila TaxID=30025 RepID=UPI0007E6259B|nr:mitochondrial carrier homolog 2 [Drosophila ficusphila]
MAGFREDARGEDTEVNGWIRFGLRLGVSAALHPFEYSKTLIQLGYEPIAPMPGKSLLGKPIMKLPNIFQYAGHIRRIDGFYGCYRGLAPKLVGSLVAMVVSERVADSLGLEQPEEIKDDSQKRKEEEEMYIQFKSSLKRDIVLTVTGIVASHPFHVISLRMMAQFVGRETLYTSIVGSVAEIWKTEGIAGFFAGLVPKLLCDVACLVLSSSTIYILNKYVIKDKLGRQYNAGFTQFAVSSLLYPLQVVSTCSTVSGSRLMAGQPPIMPAYKNWVDCWNDLQVRGELKRGSSLFWRSQAISSPAVATSFAPLPKLVRYQ